MKTLLICSAFILTLFVLPACRSLQTRLDEIDKREGPAAAFRQCCAEVDGDPENAEAKDLMIKYAGRAYNQGLQNAETYAVSQNLGSMTNLLINGRNSLKYVILESQSGGIVLPGYDINRLMARYCNLYLQTCLEKARWELDNKNFAHANKTIYIGENSADELIKFARYNTLTLDKETELQSLKGRFNRELEQFYNDNVSIYLKGDFDLALAGFKKMEGLKEANYYIKKCNAEIDYGHAMALLNSGMYRKAFNEFSEMPPDYKDVKLKMDECLEKGKVRVSVMYFDGRDNQVLYEKIIRELMKDKFIAIVNTGSYRYGHVISPEFARKNDVKYVVSGVITDIYTPFIRREKGDKKVWAVSENLEKAPPKPNSSYPRWYRRGKSIAYFEVREECRIDATIQYRIDNALNLELIALRTVGNYATDEVYYYECMGACNPERFSFKNPELDTITAKDEKSAPNWTPSYDEKNFQRYFFQSKVMRSFQELWTNLFENISYGAAREIANEIIRRESE